MVAQRNNITVIVIEWKERKYYNVMTQNKELMERVGAKVYEALTYAEWVWIDEKGQPQ
jgi:hypothetical protein